MQKDFFNTARRDFRAIAMVSIIPIVLGILGIVNGLNGQPSVMSISILALVVGLLSFAIAILISRMFKNRSAYAPTVGLVWVSVGILGILYSLVKGGSIGAVLVGALIYGYLLFVVLKARKQGMVK